ncbi:MAG: hypothetical protein P8P13_03130 [Flavobacteriaceae bacterium]|jgi:hypothetical protein|nr:hypothetical protein [Flavobacteriaceae bacterium]MDA7728088.1 hypothetical protein [Flavobacteriaceae bacterium]MDG1309472.1 hypothetical protein [Flavobacteriaceae bacterium]
MIKKFLIVITLVFSSLSYAQQGSSSPYSFYGIGSLKFKGTVENQSMGGLSVYSDSIHINLRNPASFAGKNLKSFSNEARPIKYTIGGSHSDVKLSSNSQTAKSSTTTVDYLAIAIPLGKFGAGFGILPYSSVGYKLQSTDADGVLQYKYRGEGGLNKVFLGVGYQLTNNLKLGVDASYNFGNIKNTNIAYGYNTEGDLLQYQSRESNRSDLGGLTYNFGLIFSKLINPNFEVTASATYTPSSEITSANSRAYSTIVIDPTTQQEFTINISEVDLSVFNLETTKLTLPSKTSFGVGVGSPRKWFAGVEYTYLKASQFKNRLLTIDNASYEDASTISVGGFYIPKYDSFNRYWERIVYRTGIRFEDTGLRINNQDIKEFGISFGVGLPVGRIFSNANVGFEIGTRGVDTADLVKENFVKFQISLSLNDRWFEKRKFN